MAEVDLSELRRNAVERFLDALDSVLGRKSLVLERELNAVVNSVVKFSTLQEHGCSEVYWLDAMETAPEHANVVYIVRPSVTAAERIAQHIKGNESIKATVLVIPEATWLFTHTLDQMAVLGDVSIHSIALDFIPINDEDILSLQLDTAFAELYRDHDNTLLLTMARALLQFQRTYGLFPYVFGKGDKAAMLSNILDRLVREDVAAHESASAALPLDSLMPSSVLDGLYVFDRGSDMITVLLTQLTFEGMLMERFTWSSDRIEIPEYIFNAREDGSRSETESSPSSAVASTSRMRSVNLPSNDPLYARLRDEGIANVGSVLNKFAKQLNTEYEGRHTAKDVAEIKSFVARLGSLQQMHKSLRTFTNIAEHLFSLTKDHIFSTLLELQQNIVEGVDLNATVGKIEDLIGQCVPVEQVLRILCLYSCANGGLRQKDYDSLRLQLVQTYGVKILLSFSTLYEWRMLMPKPTTSALSAASIFKRSAFAQIRRSFHLLQTEDGVSGERGGDKDISYVFGGYAPLSVRMLQCGVQPNVFTGTANQKAMQVKRNWEESQEMLRLIPGATVAVEPEPALPLKRPIASTGSTLAVLYIGGITAAEVSALRFLGRAIGKRILIFTTHMVDGARIMRDTQRAIAVRQSETSLLEEHGI